MADREVGGGRHEDQGFKGAESYKEFAVDIENDVELPSKIEKSDIRPHAIQVGETEIVLQRHGAYVRDREADNVGSLSNPDDEIAASTAYFEGFMEGIAPEERLSVDILVVASDTSYFDRGQRSYETGQIALDAAKATLDKYGLSQDQIIQETDPQSPEGQPRRMPGLREPNFLNESPEFLDFMLKEYGGINLDFWIAFEEDQHKETREAMGAEGPDEIADRMGFAVRSMARYAETYHKLNPGRRLIIWGATHYDTISPFVKRDLFEVGKEKQLMVDYGGGITIDIDSAGAAKTELGGKAYEIPLKKKRSA